jgi:mannose-6-phosphate isomerase
VEAERRPWGAFEVLAEASSHKVKGLTVEPGSRLSYRRHRHRSEHWFVVAGHGVATAGGTAHHLGPGDTIDVPSGAARRVESLGPGPLVFIEVQHGNSFEEEEETERLEDDDGRPAGGDVS